MKKHIIRFSGLFGLLIFAFIIYRIGPQKIWGHIKQLTWQYFLVLMVLRLLYWLLRTISWKVIFDGYNGGASLADLFAARLCSHSVTQLTPSAGVGGEAARILMVNCTSKRICVASVIVDKTIEFLTVTAFTIIGVSVLISRFTLPGNLKYLFMLFVATVTFLLLFLLAKQKQGLLQWLTLGLAKLRIRPKILTKNHDKIKETDQHISDFYHRNPRGFMVVFGLYSLLVLLWSAEIHLTLVFLGAQDITLLESFLITIVGGLAFLFPLVPGSLGVYEATYVALFALLGKGTDLGISLVIIRRLLALIWAGLGLLPMLKPKPVNEPSN